MASVRTEGGAMVAEVLESVVLVVDRIIKGRDGISSGSIGGFAGFDGWLGSAVAAAFGVGIGFGGSWFWFGVPLAACATFGGNDMLASEVRVGCRWDSGWWDSGRWGSGWWVGDRWCGRNRGIGKSNARWSSGCSVDISGQWGRIIEWDDVWCWCW